jgi:hypothetical protein
VFLLVFEGGKIWEGGKPVHFSSSGSAHALLRKNKRTNYYSIFSKKVPSPSLSISVICQECF